MVMLGVCGFTIKNYEMQFLWVFAGFVCRHVGMARRQVFCNDSFKFKLVTFKKFEFYNGHVTLLSFLGDQSIL